jgi:predicted dehydrogenase
MSDDLRVGIVGYGLAGLVFHAPLISATPGIRLSAIVSRDAQRVQHALETYPGVQVFGSAQDLFESTSIDVAVITTPNTTHAPIARDAISRGIAVVVDKPLAISVNEAVDLIEFAKRSGVLLTVFQNRRWDGDFLTVAALVADGTLGRVARFESRFERWRPNLKGGWRESSKPAQGGGLLFDLGPHIIDQALQLFGPVESVYAEVDTTRARATSDDDVFVALTHVSGVRSHLFASAIAADLGPRFRVLGTQGAYVTHGLDVQEASLRAGDMPDPDRKDDWGEVPRSDWGVLTDINGVTSAVPTMAGRYLDFYAQLVAAINQTGPIPVDPSQPLEALRIIEAALDSSAHQTVVKMTPNPS